MWNWLRNRRWAKHTRHVIEQLDERLEEAREWGTTERAKEDIERRVRYLEVQAEVIGRRPRGNH